MYTFGHIVQAPMLLKHAGAVVPTAVLKTDYMQSITRGSDLVGLCHVRTEFVSLTVLWSRQNRYVSVSEEIVLQ